MKTICYVAGKSGGHIMPCITHAQKLKNKQKADTIIFFSTQAKLDKNITKNKKIIDQTITLPFANVPGKKIWRYPYFMYCMAVSFLKSLFHLTRTQPDMVISMGGLICVPVCLAAKLLRIPFDLYEVNVEPGKAITFLAPMARTLYICFTVTQKYFTKITCVKTEYPVRYSQEDKQMTQEQALEKIQFTRNRKTIFILGGSQGSLFINNVIKRWLDQTPDMHQHIQIIHQTGALDTHDWKNYFQELGIPAITFAYQDNLTPYYIASDMIICRSGAGTLAETLFFQKPCTTIPLETHSTAHQTLNARARSQEHPNLVSVVYQHELDNIQPLITAISNHIN